jgi:hypothetical protein
MVPVWFRRLIDSVTRPSLRRADGAALLVVIVLAFMSWLMINAVATTLYRQFESQGDPNLLTIRVPGPGLDGKPGDTGPPPSHLGHTGYFWSERAFHYRSTLMYAVDEYQDPQLLRKDTWQQYPAGVDAWREYTILMEPIYGFLYRLAGDQSRPLVEFLLRLIPLIHVLLFVPLFLGARALGARPLLALLGVFVYATCTMGFARLTGSLLLKEDFALLCLAGYLAAHLWAWRSERTAALVLAALLLVVTLASWHLNQFLVMTVAGAAALAATVAGPAAFTRRRTAWLMPALYCTAGVTAGLTPSLAARGFVFSLPMAVLLSWLLTSLLMRRSVRLQSSGRLRMLLFAGTVAVLGTGSLLNSHYMGDYNHVFGLLVERLRHGLVKPTDPTRLPFDVRVFWDSPFLSPTVEQLRSRLGFHLLLLAPAVVWSVLAAVRRSTEPLRRSFLVTVPVMLAAFLMIERLGVVFVIFGSLAVATGAEAAVRHWSVRRPAARWPLAVAAGLMLTAGVFNLGTVMQDMLRITRSVHAGREVRLGTSDQQKWQSWTDLYDWVRRHTPGPGSTQAGLPASFLGEIGESPQLLLYTGRPVVLNSQFENAAIRARYREYLAALYARDEQVLWEFAARHQADYIFISRHFATRDETGSYVYLAGLTGGLTRDMNVVRMHFQPEGLRRFEPVYDNELYRVFKVRRDERAAGPAAWRRSFNLWWEAGNFTFDDGRLADLAGDRERIREFEGALSSLQDAQVRMLAAVEARWQQARGRGQQRPELMLLHRQYVQTLLEGLTGTARADGAAGRQGRLANAIRARLSEIDSGSGRSLAAALAALAHGPDGWLDRLRTHAGEPAHYAACGQLLALAGRYDEAAALFGEAAAFYDRPGGRPVPVTEMTVRLWQEQVWWLIGAERTEQAAELAAGFAARTPPGSPAAEYFAALAALAADD